MRIWISLVAATMLFSGLARAETQNVVLLELFTSQGCAACPPADEMLGMLAARDDVIALSLHVDYWDYIGWEDSFADATFTRRQKQYARAWNRSTVYTPQVILGGLDELKSFRRSAVNEALDQHLSRPARVHLTMTRGSNGEIELQAVAEPPLEGEAEVFFLRYVPRASVEVTSGENNGMRLTHYNIVTSLERVTRWDGQSALRLTLNAPGDDPAVVVVQEAGQGPVLAAARRR
ncbi:DUF1223 domain-containing protein [Rhodobacteraceae bacterium 2376]|uniref:DUF1223 domain-containing protein n=1 Tax=Rhabdonatronobacter sediminivivens TaxID=2743469 RepID=A0A7Z0I1P7_9RHOB|nr:DUF1223 domain-containing protein [Rhabdonatronobacter sediminivivens]NYS26319.1 DUF1223 domain-containing protein [Rhabdonatronobacter sediminivivens]